MLKALIIGVIATTFLIGSAVASSPMVLSPYWFKSVYQAATENKDDVWRGTVVSHNGGMVLTIKNLNGKNVEVTLLHLLNKKDSRKSDLALGNEYLQSLVGKQVYVLAKNNKNKVTAKLIDADGRDLNLTFIENGIFDLNETSLIGKREKNQYLNAYKTAQSLRKGIWH